MQAVIAEVEEIDENAPQVLVATVRGVLTSQLANLRSTLRERATMSLEMLLQSKLATLHAVLLTLPEPVTDEVFLAEIVEVCGHAAVFFESNPNISLLKNWAVSTITSTKSQSTYHKLRTVLGKVLAPPAEEQAVEAAAPASANFSALSEACATLEPDTAPDCYKEQLLNNAVSLYTLVVAKFPVFPNHALASVEKLLSFTGSPEVGWALKARTAEGREGPGVGRVARRFPSVPTVTSASPRPSRAQSSTPHQGPQT